MDINKILRFIENRSGCMLLIGNDSNSILKSVYEKSFSKENNYFFVENVPEDGRPFWRDFLTKTDVPKKTLNTILSNKDGGYINPASYFVGEFINKSKKNFELFIPNLDKFFYKLDVELGGIVHNSSLRKTMYETEGKLNIYGSVETEDSKEYKSTLGKISDYPFSAINFVVFDF